MERSNQEGEVTKRFVRPTAFSVIHFPPGKAAGKKRTGLKGARCLLGKQVFGKETVLSRTD